MRSLEKFGCYKMFTDLMDPLTTCFTTSNRSSEHLQKIKAHTSKHTSRTTLSIHISPYNTYRIISGSSSIPQGTCMRFQHIFFRSSFLEKHDPKQKLNSLNTHQRTTITSQIYTYFNSARHERNKKHPLYVHVRGSCLRIEIP